MVMKKNDRQNCQDEAASNSSSIRTIGGRVGRVLADSVGEHDGLEMWRSAMRCRSDSEADVPVKRGGVGIDAPPDRGAARSAVLRAALAHLLDRTIELSVTGSRLPNRNRQSIWIDSNGRGG